MTAYDRTTDGWDFTLGGHDHIIRPEGERQRCGIYTYDGEEHWGDHRVTVQGTTCVDVDCRVRHHPTVMPGWAEPMDGYHERPGVRAIAAAMWGWDAGGLHNTKLGDTSAWVAAHVALDALRDAGYVITKREVLP